MDGTDTEHGSVMADFSIQDLSSPQNDESERKTRHASFRRPDLADVDAFALTSETDRHDFGPTSPIDMRRSAAFRPPEEIAARRDVVRALKRSMENDASLLSRDGASVTASLFACAQADEALGEFESAGLTLATMKRESVAPSYAHVRAARRIWRQLGDWDLVEDSLSRGRQIAPQSLAAFEALEQATLAWLSDAPAEKIALLTSLERFDSIDPLAAFWRAQLVFDAMLSTGDIDGAMSSLEMLLEDGVELPEEVSVSLHIMCAIHENLCGNLDAASERLSKLARAGLLPEEMLDAWMFLLCERGSLGELLEVPAGAKSSRGALLARARLLLARDLNESAVDLFEKLEGASAIDAHVLRLHEQALERLLVKKREDDLFDFDDELGDEESESDDDSEIASISAAAPTRAHEEMLIQVLNLRLDVTPSDDECVSLLLRLGRLYEEIPGADDAAAEVYREALQLAPTDPAVLRALGRIYSKNSSWEQLAALYEHEINVLRDEPSVWRRHFQVAGLYEQRLQDGRAALEHYLEVLASRPHFLPALKATARLMEQTEQWIALADLFLSRVSTTTSTRQRLYMLDKVAEIAEHHIEDDNVAIGAWREILLLSPEHPNAYASLGRLLARAHRWRELVELNEQEMGRIEDTEELADLYLRNAGILERKLEDLEGAEECYRRALEMLPDFLPALEGLGRLLAGAGRWDDLCEMTREELSNLVDTREQVRQLGALAELAEFQLGRVEDAVRLHEDALAREPSDINAYFALARLYRQQARWDDLVGLLTRRLDRADSAQQIATLHASLADIHEWHLQQPKAAFDHYRAAICTEPENTHWLEGVARLWSVVGEEPGRLAHWLTEIARGAGLEGDTRDAYRKVICRLTERAAGVPEAAMDLRRAGKKDDVENGIMLRMADGLFGDRQTNALRRVHHPLHRWEVATSMPRHGLQMLPGLELTPVFKALPATALEWFLDEVELASVVRLDAAFLEQNEDQDRALGFELGALVHKGARCCHTLAGPETSLARIRFRALEARRFGETEEYEDWTRREINRLEREDIIARRYLELASTREDEAGRRGYLASAATALFPELEKGSVPVSIARPDGPVIDDLYDALYADYAWSLLRRCLDVHVHRAQITPIRRAYLWDMLSDMLERYLEDPAAAFHARKACWELTGEADHLIALVRLSEQLGKADEALEFQDKFFRKLWQRADIAPSRCVGAGLKLARMLRARGFEEDHLIAMELLEDLLARFEREVEAVDARLELARVHASHGDPYAAAELFRRTLTPERVRGREDDWREFVRIYRDGVGDVATAYNLQWTLVHSLPTSERDLVMLVDLAEEAGALDNCAHELSRLADEVGGPGRRALLWHAAMIFDDHLGWFEDASHIYQDLLVGFANEEERVRLTRRLAMSQSRLPKGQTRALELFRELLTIDPFDVATYRGMASLFTDINTYDRARVVTQVQRALGDNIEVEQVRTKTVPSRTLEEAEVLETLLPEGLNRELVEALRMAMPLAQKVWSEALPQRKAIENDRRASRELMPIADLFYTVGDAFQLGRLKVWFGDSQPWPVQVLTDGQPLIWLNTETLAAFDEPELRFMAGYTAALATTELAPLLQLDGRSVWHLLEGVYYRQMGKGFSERVDVASQEMAEQTSSPLFAVARRRLLQALEPVADQLATAHCEAWSRALEQFAYRVGLVLCGDIEAAARCILKLEGWRGDLFEPGAQKVLRRHAHLRELITFALSEDYLEVRYALGLAGRPSVLGI